MEDHPPHGATLLQQTPTTKHHHALSPTQTNNCHRQTMTTFASELDLPQMLLSRIRSHTHIRPRLRTTPLEACSPRPWSVNSPWLSEISSGDSPLISSTPRAINKVRHRVEMEQEDRRRVLTRGRPSRPHPRVCSPPDPNRRSRGTTTPHRTKEDNTHSRLGDRAWRLTRTPNIWSGLFAVRQAGSVCC